MMRARVADRFFYSNQGGARPLNADQVTPMVNTVITVIMHFITIITVKFSFSSSSINYKQCHGLSKKSDKEINFTFLFSLSFKKLTRTI